MPSPGIEPVTFSLCGGNDSDVLPGFNNRFNIIQVIYVIFGFICWPFSCWDVYTLGVEYSTYWKKNTKEVMQADSVYVTSPACVDV